MPNMVHYHVCTLPLTEDPEGQIVCTQLIPVSWVELDEDALDIRITARNSHPDDDVIIVEVPRSED